MNKTVTPSPLSDEYAIALEIKQQECRDLLLGISDNDSPRIVVGKIADYVDHLLAGNRPAKDMHEYVLQLGALYGGMIEEEYGWQWQHLHLDGRQGLFLVSLGGAYRCSPLYFLNHILTGSDTAEEEKNTNDVVPFFNRIHTLANPALPHQYQPVAS